MVKSFKNKDSQRKKNFFRPETVLKINMIKTENKIYSQIFKIS